MLLTSNEKEKNMKDLKILRLYKAAGKALQVLAAEFICRLMEGLEDVFVTSPFCLFSHGI